MSHYSVAVFHKSGQDIDEMLAPYDENREITASDMRFVDQTDFLRKTYKTGSVKGYKFEDGHVVEPLHDELFVTATKTEYFLAKSERKAVKRKRAYGKMVYLIHNPKAVGAEEVQVKPSEIFTFHQFCKSWGYVKKGKQWGYLSNPCAKWDWYEIGGRWDGILKLKEGKQGVNGTPGIFGREIPYDGKHVSRAYVSDVDFEPEKDIYDRSIRFWEVVVDGDELRTGENKDMFFNFYKPEYYKERYGSKENYAKESATFTTYAVITPDGEWHAPGTMGWFGMSDSTTNDEKDWTANYKSRFIDSADEDTIITIVDCHI